MTTRGKWLEHRLHKNRASSKNPDGDRVPRHFQISVNILEGKKLAWGSPSEATSYVTVTLDEVKYRTSVRQSMKVPYYRENFVFEWFGCAHEVQHKALQLAVFEPWCYNSPRLLGKAEVDLAYVWKQPNHTMTPKWAQLTLSTDVERRPTGYLRLDISIVPHRRIPESGQEKIADNLLLCGAEQQPACYQVTVHRAYNVPCNANVRPDMLGSPPSTCLRVTFGGLSGHTSVQQRTSNPFYTERVSIVDMFPHGCDVIRLDVCSAAKVLASARLRLSQISYRGENGFLPTFGPSLLHMYAPWCSEYLEEDGPFYRGSLLVTVRTIVPYYKRALRTVNVEPMPVSIPAREWFFEDFILFCPIFEVSMLDRRMFGPTCGVAVTVGEISCNMSTDQDFERQMCEIKQRKLHYTGNMAVKLTNPILGSVAFETIYPIMTLAVRLPDFRFRMYRENLLQGIVTNLETNLANISSRLLEAPEHSKDLLESLNCCKDDAAAMIGKFLNVVQYSVLNSEVQKYSNELDLKVLLLQKEKIEGINRRLASSNTRSAQYKNFREENNCKKIVKRMLAEGRALVQDLKSLIFKIPDGWPTISIWLLNNGSRVAYAKMAPADVIHSDVAEQSGRYCGKIRTVYLKPIKCQKHPPSDCSCISGKVELLPWLGAFKQRTEFTPCIPTGYEIIDFAIKCEPLSIECCVNIYRAKLDCKSEAKDMSPFMRVHFMNDVKDTQVQHSINPVWSEVLRLCCSACTSVQRLERSPPEILIELYHFDASQTVKMILLGRFTMTPEFVHNCNYPPPLKWFDVHMETDFVGKIQMSAQIMQVPEATVTQSTKKKSLAPNRQVYQAQLLVNHDGMEPLPVSLVPVNHSYKIDVYWWGLRDIRTTHKPCMRIELEDIAIDSGIITEHRNNCNFPHNRVSKIFSGNLNKGSSTLTVKLFDSTTFGRTLFVGLNIVKSPQKYLIDWIPRREREEMLFSSSVTSNSFMQVSRNTFIKMHATCPNAEIFEKKNSYNEKASLIQLWRRIFSKKFSEEEFLLLPIFTKEPKCVKRTDDNWWTRYYTSLNLFTIPSELLADTAFTDISFIWSGTGVIGNVLNLSALKRIISGAVIQDRVSSDKELTGKRIMIYDSELESQPDFFKFKDWCRTIKIYSGNKSGMPEKDEQLRYGYLKACIAIYEWPPPEKTLAVSYSGVDLSQGYFSSHPPNGPSRYLTRIYCVKCSGLVTAGYTTSSKCHVAVQVGSRRLGDRSEAVLRSAETVFGKMFELPCTLPQDYLLKVSVMDNNPAAPDDLIGSTVIDLEDRVYSRHRSMVGLAAEYNTCGLNKWRDSHKPSAILEHLCARNHLPAPEYPDRSTVVFNGVEYKNAYTETVYTSPCIQRENICLGILHNWHTLPICGYKLVPEHVEARALYDPEKPGVEQGKIHLWVDIFSLDCGRPVPSPVHICPRPAEEYELRVIVWALQGLKVRGSNVYVKVWIGPSDMAQETDVHYCVNGDARFNWRMVFQFQYKHNERKLQFDNPPPSLEMVELYPPVLIAEVMDMECSKTEDYLGILTLDLTAMPQGTSLARYCTSNTKAQHNINMFGTRSTRGWWPLKMINRNTGNYYHAGVIDLEITLLPKEKALLVPVGLGRHPPSPLPDPMRNPLAVNGYNCPVVFKHQGSTLAVFGLFAVAACLYWDLPVMLYDLLNVVERSRSY